MKTKLFFILLFVSSLSFSQNWSQVGATQFTNFASDGAMAFDNMGTPYVIYVNPTASNKAYIKTFNGTNWVDTAIPEVSSTAAANVAIKVNPITNDLWVAYRRTSDDKLDVYSWNGTNWTAEGIAQGTGDLSDHRVQIQFNVTGNARIAARISSRPLRIFTYNTGSWIITEETLLNQSQYMVDQRYDFASYDSYFVSASFTGNTGQVAKRAVGSTGYTTLYSHYLSGRQMKEISGIEDENFLAAKNTAVNQIVVLNQPGWLTPNTESLLNQTTNTNPIVSLGKSSANNQLYLMYSDASSNLTFKNYESSATNAVTATLPAIGLSTSTTNFFCKMEMNPVNGDAYVMYYDGGKISVQSYSILAPLTKYYVNANVTGGDGSGDSWANAMTDLNTAFDYATSITTEIWVAGGSYTPTGNGSSSTFAISNNNFKLYGGFNGTETLVADRDLINNPPTVFEGDINGNDASSDPYHSTRSDNIKNMISVGNHDFELNGVTIQNTNASTGGAAVQAHYKNGLTLKNNKFLNNATSNVGLIYFQTNHYSTTSFVVENCEFKNNVGEYFGQVIHCVTGSNSNLDIQFTNNLFVNNTASTIFPRPTRGSATAYFLADGTSSNITGDIVNCTFANNINIVANTGIESAVIGLGQTDGTNNINIYNSIIYNNTIVGGAVSPSVGKLDATAANLVLINNSIGEDNFSNLIYLTNTSNANPLFTDAANNDFTLQATSPAVDSGDNTKIPSGITTDLLSSQRIFNTTVDMGCYEFGAVSLGVNTITIKNDFTIYPNPTATRLNVKTNADIENIEIYTLQGQKVLQTNLDNINVSNLSNGMYIIKAQTKTGAVLTKQFIKR